MKTFLPLQKAVFAACLLGLISLHGTPAAAQDGSLSQDYKNGVIASSMSAKGGYQSVVLNWEGVNFSSSNANKAGYLILYSTGTPSLLSAANGRMPNNAVMNGTVVATAETFLPIQPAVTATANGLANGTTYIFMIVAYTWDGSNVSSYNYSAPATICVTIPPDAPNAINIQTPASSSAITGSFGEPMFAPDGYVVSYSSNANAPALVNGTVYTPGQAFAGDTIAQTDNSTSFSTSNSGLKLSPATSYYIHVFSYVMSRCDNKPVYSTAYLSSDSVITASVPPPVDTTSSTKDFMDVIDVEPNPLVNNGWLRIATHVSDNNVNIAIFTVEGKLMAARRIQVFAGTNRINLNTMSFAPGSYILRAIFSTGKTKAIEFIKR